MWREALPGIVRASVLRDRALSPLRPDGVCRVGQRLEFGDLRGSEGAALQHEAAHRTRRKAPEIAGIGRTQIALCRDVQPHRFGDGRAEPPGEPGVAHILVPAGTAHSRLGRRPLPTPPDGPTTTS